MPPTAGRHPIRHTHRGPSHARLLPADGQHLLASRRVIVVLDNAATAEQVRPLLPGAGRCLVLVTSRNRLTGLVVRDAAVRITLDVLSQDEAVELLAAVIGAKRLAAAGPAARQFARLCGYLPLALRVAAERVAGDRTMQVAVLLVVGGAHAAGGTAVPAVRPDPRRGVFLPPDSRCP